MKVQSMKGTLFILIPKVIERANKWSKGMQIDFILNRKTGNYELIERDETKH